MKGREGKGKERRERREEGEAICQQPVYNMCNIRSIFETFI
jgi:hypothetical protein